jgi:hypothetical protein
MSYGVEIAGETTLIGWSDAGEIQPWTEHEAGTVLLDTAFALRLRGVDPLPAMRIVLLAE